MVKSLLLTRLSILIIASSATLFPSFYQSLIDWLYHHLLTSQLFNLSFFETLWTVVIYGVLEYHYTIKFLRNPSLRMDVRTADRRRPKMRRPSRRLKEITVYIAPLLAMDLVLVKKYADVPLTEIMRVGEWDPQKDIIGRFTASFLRPNLHHFSVASPLQLYRALPPQAPSSRRLVLELISSLLLYDTLFFLAHLALHSIPLLHLIHLHHHRHAEIHPQITNQLDVVERLTLVLLANFSLNILGSHVLTRTAFVPVFLWLLVEIHSGLDLPTGYEKLLPQGWGAGAMRHAIHHRDGNEYYEPFFCWWDDLLEILIKSSGPADTQPK
jgi:cholesterol 25-hydroxylase